MSGTMRVPVPRERKPMKPMRRKTTNGKDRWVARVWDRHTGRFKSLGTFDKKGDAQDVINAFYAKPQPRTLETCDSFALRWPDAYPRPKQSTNTYNRERVKKFADDFKGVPLADVDRPRARAWALENRLRVSAVRAMFNDALDDELVLRNPFANLRLPQSRGRADIRALTEPEIRDLADLALRVCSPQVGETVRAMILFSAYVGLRQGEMFALRLIDLGHEELTIRRTLSKTGELTAPKNGRERTVAFLPQARQALERVPRRVGQEFVFEQSRGGHWTYNALVYWWYKVRAAAGLPAMAWHELRHASATMMIERGLSYATIAHQLGHVDGGVLVAKTYGHPEASRMRQEIRAAFSANVADLAVVKERKAS